MLDGNKRSLIQSNKNIAISVQVIAEDMNRYDLNRLEKFEKWLRLEGVDNEILGIFLQWARGLIDDNLRSDLRLKSLMQMTNKSQEERPSHHEGDNAIS